MTVSEQVLSLFAAKYKFLRDIEVKDIADYEKKMHAYMHEQHADIIAELDEKEAISPELEEKIKTALEAFKDVFVSLKG